MVMLFEAYAQKGHSGGSSKWGPTQKTSRAWHSEVPLLGARTVWMAHSLQQLMECIGQ
jgi:hypothetical protein